MTVVIFLLTVVTKILPSSLWYTEKLKTWKHGSLDIVAVSAKCKKCIEKDFYKKPSKNDGCYAWKPCVLQRIEPEFMTPTMT